MLFGAQIFDLAGACGFVTAAAIFQAQIAHMGFAGAVQDRLANRQDRVLFVFPP